MERLAGWILDAARWSVGLPTWAYFLAAFVLYVLWWVWMFRTAGSSCDVCGGVHYGRTCPRCEQRERVKALDEALEGRDRRKQA